MSSIQISTSPLLRQFATDIGEGDCTVTSKLGPQTVSRVRFKRLDFPVQQEEQVGFLRERIEEEHPGAHQLLAGMFDLCLADQAKAVRQLLSRES